VAPHQDHPARCETIVEWIDHRTPTIKTGLPNMAGVTACEGSNNCPEGSVCCLHAIGTADVQAVVCHASLDECPGEEEVCGASSPSSCRTPGTKCKKSKCVK